MVINKFPKNKYIAELNPAKMQRYLKKENAFQHLDNDGIMKIWYALFLFTNLLDSQILNSTGSTFLKSVRLKLSDMRSLFASTLREHCWNALGGALRVRFHLFQMIFNVFSPYKLMQTKEIYDHYHQQKGKKCKVVPNLDRKQTKK
jgi:hypothetical protein